MSKIHNVANFVGVYVFCCCSTSPLYGAADYWRDGGELRYRGVTREIGGSTRKTLPQVGGECSDYRGGSTTSTVSAPSAHYTATPDDSVTIGGVLQDVSAPAEIEDDQREEDPSALPDKAIKKPEGSFSESEIDKKYRKAMNLVKEYYYVDGLRKLLQVIALDPHHVGARYNLGVLYEFGMGPERSLEKASAYYSEAAIGKHPDAAKALRRVIKKRREQ